MLALKSITNSDLLTFGKIEICQVKEYYSACWTAKKLNCDEISQIWYQLSSMWLYTDPGYCGIIVILEILSTFLLSGKVYEMSKIKADSEFLS